VVRTVLEGFVAVCLVGCMGMLIWYVTVERSNDLADATRFDAAPLCPATPRPDCRSWVWRDLQQVDQVTTKSGQPDGWEFTTTGPAGMTSNVQVLVSGNGHPPEGMPALVEFWHDRPVAVSVSGLTARTNADPDWRRSRHDDDVWLIVIVFPLLVIMIGWFLKDLYAVLRPRPAEPLDLGRYSY